MARDERDVARHRLQPFEAARHRQSKGEGGLRIEAPDLARDLERGFVAIAVVDPIPREITDRDRRDAGRVSGGDGKRWNVADGHACPALAQVCRFRCGEGRQALLKLDSLPNAACGVHVQAVDLHHPRIALQFDELTSPLKGAGEQPERRGGFHHDVRLRPCAEQRVDDRGCARRVAETVPRDVKDDAI